MSSPVCQPDPDAVAEATDRVADEMALQDEQASLEPSPAATAELLRASRWNTALLAGLLTIAAIVCLYQARTYFLPIAVAFFFNLLFKPVTRKLKRHAKVPHPVGAMLVLAIFLGLSVGSIYFLAEPVTEWMERAPQNLDDASQRISELLYEPMKRVTDAAERVEEIANATTDDRTPEVAVERRSVVDRLVTGTTTFLSGLFVVAGLLYFLLAAGDRMSKSMAMLLPRGEPRRKAILISNAIENQVSVYLGVVTLINAGLGVAIAIAMWLFGMPNPILWGVMAMLFNFVPYLGAVLGVVIVSFVGLASLDQPLMALAVGGVYLSLTTIEGTFVTPTILGDRFRINPVFIFLWLLFFAWLWGAVGALLAVPFLTIVKITCEHIDRLEPVNEILSC